MTTPTNTIGNIARIDWGKCIFCQKHSRCNKTNCPAESKRKDIGSGYKSLADLVQGFIQLGELPVDVRHLIQFWDEGDGVEATCARNRAFWHIKCRHRFVHETKLQRVQEALAKHDTTFDDTDAESCGIPSPKRPRLTRCSVDSSFNSVIPVCFFCDEPSKQLRQVMTFAVDERVRACAKITNDTMLLGKLSMGDLIAIEAKYHPSCLLALYEKASRVTVTGDTSVKEVEAPRIPVAVESLALAEVIAYMEDMKLLTVSPTVFKLSELSKLYASKLEKFAVHAGSKIHSSRFKERLLQYCPMLTAVSHGREVLLTFSDNVGTALHQMRDNADADAVHLMHAAELLRKEIFGHGDYQFIGSLCNDKKCVPSSLYSFTKMVLEGPGNEDCITTQAALTISQLIMFNAIKQRRKMTRPHEPTVTNIRHLTCRETPVPVYLGLMLHSATRQKKLVDKCHKLGLSVSYERVMQITNKMTNAVCNVYHATDVVCPPVLQPGLLTVAAVDNIDHNLSSSTASSSFHGTAISLTQFPIPNANNVDNAVINAFNAFKQASDSASEINLPVSYTEVYPCILPSVQPVLTNPAVNISLSEKSVDITATEYDWLEAVYKNIDSSDYEPHVSWAAFHAQHDSHEPSNCVRPIMALLPLFRHTANTPAMIKHSFIVAQKAIARLNPGQIPILAFDQPLYALAKQIQWHWPQKFGEDKFLVLMGGLHIEMSALRMLGRWLDGTGWVQCLIQAGIASAGVADSFLSCSHVKRTRNVHTVTAAALYLTLKRQYASYCSQCLPEVFLTFCEWCDDRCKSSAQFHFWFTVLKLQLLVLTFVRSIRLRDFLLYTESLQKLVPWFFACDQTNYARWLPVHIRDILSLPHVHPTIYNEFMAGKFALNKSGRKFSAIAIDHAHEQLNAVIKGNGGAVGLTENESGLIRWTICGPEVVRLLDEFESSITTDVLEIKHHDQTLSIQKQFRRDVAQLCNVLENENVFTETTGNELIVLGSNRLADPSVLKTVQSAEDLGLTQFRTFFKERLMGTCSTSVLATLTRNKLPFFSFKLPSTKKSANSLKVKILKSDCELFQRLYIACQNRAEAGDLDEFFRHENQPYPPSISQQGVLRLGTKSDLLDCLKSLSNKTLDIPTLHVDAYILDGAVIVQMLRPGLCKTFDDYRQKVFVPYLVSLLKKVSRVDVVFDVYFTNSLKQMTRDKRGSGSKTLVAANTKLPSNWPEFLREDDNKTALFRYLAECVLDDCIDVKEKVVLITTDGFVKTVARNVNTDLISPCSHEEADTRLILHSLHAAQNGCSRLAIRTVDTDVVVLAVSFYSKLRLDELWIHFGVGKHVRLIPVHDLSAALGPDRCTALPMFHALTGCDTVSCFFGKGKKTAWTAWECFPEVTSAFVDVHFNDVNDASMLLLERFIVIMYDRTCECTDLDAARKYLFTKKDKSFENIPPTSDAFTQHVKRSIFQVHCWSHALKKQPPEADPSLWGWSLDGGRWIPVWMTLPEISKSCQELLSCKCKTVCSENGRCKCFQANLRCTALCLCDGECFRAA